MILDPFGTFFFFEFPAPGIDGGHVFRRQLILGKGVHHIVFLFNMAFQQPGIPHGFRQDIQLIFGLRFLFVLVQCRSQAHHMVPSQVVLHQHPMGYQVIRHPAQFGHHHREQKLFFLPMMVFVRIVPDEIHHLPEIPQIHRRSFQDPDRDLTDHFQHPADVVMFFFHQLNTVSHIFLLQAALGRST